jgi:hypothetical protein
MKPKDIFKDIFSLAVRLLGLYFLFVAVKDLDVPTLMDVATLKGDKLEDIINVILPAVFNLVVAWWLLGGTWLIRRAYPAAPKISDYSQPQADRIMSAPKTVPSSESTDARATEKKLAALVAKPKDERAI